MLALHEPYVLAFEPSFVEIRHIETGLLSQVIQGFNLRLLFADTPPSVTNTATQQYNPHQGYQYVLTSSLDWPGLDDHFQTLRQLWPYDTTGILYFPASAYSRGRSG